MADRERLELLCSRYFDGDLTDSEAALLHDALERDPALKAFYEELQAIHESVAKLAEDSRLPAGFAGRVIDKLPEAKIHRMPMVGFREIAAAAAIVLFVGLVAASVIINDNGKPEGGPEIAFGQPGSNEGAVESGDSFTGPAADLVAYSSGDMQVVTDKGSQTIRRFEGRVSLPTVVSAPADTHAVMQVGDGVAILSPGSSARLTDVDADGVADFEPIDGDLYLESRTGVRSKVDGISLKVDGGLTLRRTADGYLAEPSHGGALVGEYSIAYRQCAVIQQSGVSLQDCAGAALDSWAIDGRVDAIRAQVKKLMGAKFDEVPQEVWDRSEKMLRGVLTRPSQSATWAYMIRFGIRHGLFEDTSAADRVVWTKIADLVGEGTTKDDIPVQMMQMLQAADEELRRNPEAVYKLRHMLREMMERAGE